MKTKTMTLQQVMNREATKEGDYDYKIVKMTDSIEYYVGQILKRDVVEHLCSKDSWKITIA